MPAIMSEPLSVDGPRRDHDLIFYSLSDCAICRRAQKYLKEKGFAYRLLVVDQLQPAEKDRLRTELARKHGVRPAFPALVVDDSRFLLGFFPKAWDQTLGEGGTHA